MRTVALMGAHRTGKTTLAKAYADSKGCDFVSCSVSPAYVQLNIPMGTQVNFLTRMAIQDTALNLYQNSLNTQLTTGREFISDRCFLDLVAYTLADYPNTATPDEATWLADYTEKCLRLNEEYFHSVALIRPGIPLSEDVTSWSGDKGVIDKVDACMLWVAELAGDSVFSIPKEALDLTKRLKILEVINNESWVQI